MIRTSICALIALLFIGLVSCGKAAADKTDAAAQLEKNLAMYNSVWDTFLKEGDTSVVNSDNFTEDVIVVTDQGNLVGIDACREFYQNYLDGFSEIEWTIIDAFGQGDRLVKHWNFKGKHTGTFFGMPATNNYLDLSGTTIVTMRGGKIAKEHDFFDMKSLLDQLSFQSEETVTIDESRPMN